MAVSLRQDSSSTYGSGHNVRLEVGVPISESQSLRATLPAIVRKIDHKAFGLDVLTNEFMPRAKFAKWILSELQAKHRFSKVSVRLVFADGLTVEDSANLVKGTLS